MPIDAESSWIYLPSNVYGAFEWWFGPNKVYIQSNLSDWSALESRPDKQKWLLAPQKDEDSQVVVDALRQAPCEYYSLVFPILYSLPTGSALPDDGKEALQMHRTTPLWATSCTALKTRSSRKRGGNRTC